MSEIDSESIVYESFCKKRSKDCPHLTLFAFPLINFTTNVHSNFIPRFKANMREGIDLNLIGRILTSSESIKNDTSKEFSFGATNNYTKIYECGALEFHGSYEIGESNGHHLVYPGIIYREIFNSIKSALNNFREIFSNEAFIGYIHLYLPQNSILIRDTFLEHLHPQKGTFDNCNINLDNDIWGFKFIGNSNYILTGPLFFGENSWFNESILHRHLVVSLCEFWNAYGIFQLPNYMYYIGDIDATVEENNNEDFQT